MAAIYYLFWQMEKWSICCCYNPPRIYFSTVSSRGWDKNVTLSHFRRWLAWNLLENKLFSQRSSAGHCMYKEMDTDSWENEGYNCQLQLYMIKKIIALNWERLSMNKLLLVVLRNAGKGGRGGWPSWRVSHNISLAFPKYKPFNACGIEPNWDLKNQS